MYKHSKPEKCQYSFSKSYFTNIEFQNVSKAFVYITDCNPSLILLIRMYICMYILYTCIYVGICVYMYRYICIYVYVCMHVKCMYVISHVCKHDSPTSF